MSEHLCGDRLAEVLRRLEAETAERMRLQAEVERLRATVDRLLEIRTYVAVQLRYNQLPEYIVSVLDDTRDAAEAAGGENDETA